MIHLEVAVAAPVTETLTYGFPAAEASRLQPGMRLLVPLGRRQATGYLLTIRPAADTSFRIKPVTDVLDSKPLFPAGMIPFFHWIAAYYRYPLGEVIKIALPGGLTQQSERHISLTEAGKEVLADFLAAHGPDAPPWLAELTDRESLSPARVRLIWSSRKWRKLLETWQNEGAVTISEAVSAARTKAKTEICVGLINEAPPLVDMRLKTSEKKAMALLLELLANRLPPVVPVKELNHTYSGAGKALKSLAAKGLVFFQEQQVIRDPFGEEPTYFPEPPQLSSDQEKVLAELLPAIDRKSFAPFLLFGVTGSGKTEIYLQAARRALAANRSVLVLVPEIALASQLEAHFYSRFGKTVALLHSGLSQGERYDQWHQIMGGEAKIVIGARSAIFAPLNDPGLIIVDEEHDSAYKQEDTLRYQARDLAVLRGKLQQCPVLLGSATPSLTTFYHASSGKYQLLTLPKRIENRPLPQVTIVDLRLTRKESGGHPFFSRLLLESIKDNLEQGDQSIIFLNRRGYANLMICDDCGDPVKCPHCDISLTLHKSEKILSCHYCGFQARSSIICPSCRSARVKEIGFGTERVEEALRELFPQARIARLDRDTSTNRKDFLKILKSVHQLETDILVGTQMITKGHHFPHVTLVGVIWADAGLGMPDFKAGERTFQLISQVTGRAGRGDKPGRVIVQTHQPDHYSITNAENHDYRGFYEKELKLRQALQYPPFSRLINLRFTGDSEELVRNAATLTAQQARQLADTLRVTLLGPAASPLARIKDKYRWQLLVKGAESNSLHALCDSLAGQPVPAVRATKVTMVVDVDPESML
ncbi:MAG: primosomal protein N' [Proteobacteria bacterium]|nr:primosomal protein N' [Pseudomonadota bacterium]MBU4296096.1 primosomal protein N' [Pseudomonadota bacterium]MCG2746980.1 primosomal protein N' [Desulfobulbaceae bacterium]